MLGRVTFRDGVDIQEGSQLYEYMGADNGMCRKLMPNYVINFLSAHVYLARVTLSLHYLAADQGNYKNRCRELCSGYRPPPTTVIADWFSLVIGLILNILLVLCLFGHTTQKLLIAQLVSLC